MNILEQHKKEMVSFIEKSMDEMAKQIGLPSPGCTIGVTCDDTVQLDYIPPQPPDEVPKGFYTDLSGQVHVEVVSYSNSTRQVVYNFLSDSVPGTCDMETFQRIYRRPPGYLTSNSYGLPG